MERKVIQQVGIIFMMISQVNDISYLVRGTIYEDNADRQI